MERIIVILSKDGGRQQVGARLNNVGRHITRECKLKSMQGAGPSRQAVMEAFLVMTDINEDRPYNWQKRKWKSTKAKLQRNRPDRPAADGVKRTNSKEKDIEEIGEILMNISLADKAKIQMIRSISKKDLLEDVFLSGVIPDDVLADSPRFEFSDSLKKSITSDYFHQELQKVIEAFNDEDVSVSSLPLVYTLHM